MPRKSPRLAQPLPTPPHPRFTPATVCAGLSLAEGYFELLSSFSSAGQGVVGVQEPTSLPLSCLDLSSLPARISHFRSISTLDH